MLNTDVPGNTGGDGGINLPNNSFKLSIASVTIVPVVQVTIAGLLLSREVSAGVPSGIILPNMVPVVSIIAPLIVEDPLIVSVLTFNVLIVCGADEEMAHPYPFQVYVLFAVVNACPIVGLAGKFNVVILIYFI